MSAFTVTVMTATHRFRFNAIGENSFAVREAAADRFGDLCGVTVIPARVAA